MPSTGKRARAEAAFAIYAGLGAGRSLRRIQEMQVLLGVKPYALSTLENYSREFDWQRRVQEFDATAAASLEADAEGAAAAMRQRQAQAGALAQQISLDGLEAFQGDPALLRAEGVAALGLLLERGAKLERLARGDVTEGTETVVVSALTAIIEGISNVFVRVNILPDPDHRAALFASEADRVVNAEIGKLALPG